MLSDRARRAGAEPVPWGRARVAKAKVPARRARPVSVRGVLLDCDLIVTYACNNNGGSTLDP